MARDYGVVSHRFWTGPTGVTLRNIGPHAQLVALYLVTCRSANMIGLYYLPLELLAAETGLKPKKVSFIMEQLAAIGFAHYDDASLTVYVPEMARIQIGQAELSENDKRVNSVRSQFRSIRHSTFATKWLEKYGKAYCVTTSPSQALPKGKPSLSEGASEGMPKPLRRDAQAPLKGCPSPSEGKALPLAGSEIRDQRSEIREKEEVAPTGDSSAAEITEPAKPAEPPEPKPSRPRRRDELFDAVAEVTGAAPKAAGSFIASVCKKLRAEEPPFTPEEVRAFWTSTHCDWLREKGERPPLGWLVQNIGKIRAPKPEPPEDKYARMAREACETLKRQEEQGGIFD